MLADTSQREAKLAAVVGYCRVNCLTDGAGQLMRGLFPYTLHGRGYADANPAGRSEDGAGER